jgi:putative ABC transport system substrate-binding protein
LKIIGAVLTGVLTLGLLAAPLGAQAQQARKVYRIGFLLGGSQLDAVQVQEAFRQGLRDLGYVEGRNLSIEYRFAEGRLDRFPALAAELVSVKVDVIFAPGTAAAQAAMKSTATIPIVIATAGNPVGDRLIGSLARPGGNVTGLTMVAGPELGGKYLELLKEAAPGVSRVAVLGNPLTAPHTALLKEARIASRALGLEIEPVSARRPDEIDGAFAAMSRARADGLIVLPDPVFLSLRARIADLASKARLPAMYGFREEAEAGGLMSYGASLPDLLRRAAVYVDKILKGAKPADLPVEQPTKFELVINLKTAKVLGLTIPQSLLLRADQVIE